MKVFILLNTNPCESSKKFCCGVSEDLSHFLSKCVGDHKEKDKPPMHCNDKRKKNLHCFTLRGLNERKEVDLKEFLIMGEITVPGIEMFGYDSFIQPGTSFF